MSKNQEAVEEHRDTEALLAVLDAGDQMPSATRLRARSYEQLSLVPDSTVVDVGCGAGRAVAELAERGVRAVGVDPDPWMLAAPVNGGRRPSSGRRGRRICRSPTEACAATGPTRSSTYFGSQGAR